MADSGSQNYLKRVPPVEQLAEKRSIVQAQWAISATLLVVTAGLALWGHVPVSDSFLYELLDKLTALICFVLFLMLTINVFRRGIGRSTTVRMPFGPLLLSSAAFWVWMAITDEAFVRPIEWRELLVWVFAATTGVIATFVLLGIIYLIGRLFRPGEPKEIN